MARKLKIVLISLGIIIVVLVAAGQIGSALWNKATVRAVAELHRGRTSGEAKVFTGQELAGLPAPVARYLRMALKEGQRYIRSARIVQEGELRLRQDDRRWSLFTAHQEFTVPPAGFVWDARVRLLPILSARIRDSYLAGRASMRGKLFGFIPVVNASGTPNLAQGALQRYLAEMVWFPTAFLPGQGVTWTAVDDSRALATLSDSGTTVSLEFQFNKRDEVAKVFTPGRYRQVGGDYVLTPWGGVHWNYEERQGVRIPTGYVVVWYLPDGNFDWLKGLITDIRYEFEP
ncbi:MAG: hypothetical protein OEW05_11485 [Candidatus Aminicenantes bacterium]|nr:hypothetical protein [Candidatus Aminicenantes bacterium]